MKEGFYQPSVPRKDSASIRYFHPGDKAPNFTLEGVENLQLKSFCLKDYLGKWVLLFFYGSNFTYV
ncbi:hypothetical protein BJL90_12185 [Clostridium formicaceticum]|uniref:Alkyl hydroperoxide reductase subunit C/ Thiol specific antioxidant domain-containing protein n=1 Tax=Clostridium formicaceticum TaxID=1497 RepID=A0ABM6EZI8_9CLOT|nr:hypothetical protein BJL90_12185 [Clostridium formicaceticum]